MMKEAIEIVEKRSYKHIQDTLNKIIKQFGYAVFTNTKGAEIYVSKPASNGVAHGIDTKNKKITIDLKLSDYVLIEGKA